MNDTEELLKLENDFLDRQIAELEEIITILKKRKIHSLNDANKLILLKSMLEPLERLRNSIKK